MMLILMMVMFSLGQVVLDSNPAENPPTENDTCPPERYSIGLKWCPPCPSTCESCESNTTCTLCKIGYYGQDCLEKCQCGNKSCNIETGECPPDCLDGRYGPECTLPCPGSDRCKKCDPNTGKCLQCHDNYLLRDDNCLDANTNLGIPSNLTETDASSVTTNKGIYIAYQIGLFISIGINIFMLFYCIWLKRQITNEDSLPRQVSNEVRIEIPTPVQCVDNLPKPVEEQNEEIDEDSDSDSDELQVDERDHLYPSDDDTDEKHIRHSFVEMFDG